MRLLVSPRANPAVSPRSLLLTGIVGLRWVGTAFTPANRDVCTWPAGSGLVGWTVLLLLPQADNTKKPTSARLISLAAPWSTQRALNHCVDSSLPSLNAVSPVVHNQLKDCLAPCLPHCRHSKLNLVVFSPYFSSPNSFVWVFFFGRSGVNTYSFQAPLWPPRSAAQHSTWIRGCWRRPLTYGPPLNLCLQIATTSYMIVLSIFPFKLI